METVSLGSHLKILPYTQQLQQSASLACIQILYNAIEGGLSDHLSNTQLKLEQLKFQMMINPTNPSFSNISIMIPSSVKTLKKRYNIIPVVIVKTCFPNCYNLSDITILSSPHTSSHDSTNFPQQYFQQLLMGNHGNQSKFSSALLCQKPTLSVPFPIKTLFYQSIKTWLSERMMWPSFENDLILRRANTHNCSSLYCDIYDGSQWQNFLDETGESYPQQSGNFSFGLYLDWLNPHGVRSHSKSVSLGVISLICLNLPPSQRYKPHNMFVYGFTPTPKEPKSTQLKNLLEPLIEEFLDLWKGFFIPKTAKNPEGITIRGEIILLLGNTPALRKLGVFSSHSSNLFCAHCKLPRDQINILDTLHWPLIISRDHLVAAEAWSQSINYNQSPQILSESGARYTVFQKLPYWSTVEMMTIDIMHVAILGVLKDYSLTYLKLDNVGCKMANQNLRIKPIPI